MSENIPPPFTPPKKPSTKALVVRSHRIEGLRPVAHGGPTVAHVGRCAVCGATATRVNYTGKARRGEYIMNPGQPLLCRGTTDVQHPVVGPVAGPHGSRPAVVA